MKRNVFTLVLIFAFVLSACAPAFVPPTEETTEEPSPLPTPTGGPVSGGGYPPAVFAARDALASRLGVTADEIGVANIESVDWTDSCMGVYVPGEGCAEVMVPGYRVILQVGLTQYEFHTNADGSKTLLVGDPIVSDLGEEQLPVFVWESTDCDKASVSLDGIAFGRCDGDLVFKPWNGYAPASMQDFILLYNAFYAATSAGTLQFNGRGPLIATPAEQRMMAEWVKLQFMIAQSDRAGAAWGLALAWSRQGGFAGFCDDVVIYLDGSASVSSCKTSDMPRPPFRLTTTQLEKLYFWVDNYRNVDYEYTDPAVVDAMTTRLMLTGKGAAQPSDETIRLMTEFAADLAARSTFSAQPGNQLFAAQDVLSQYFSALNTGVYTLAAKLYGGETAQLEVWNPDAKGDLPGLLERACTQNGLQCLLPRSVTYRGPDERGGYQFVVEFSNPDGSLFRYEPCCQNPGGATISSFIFSVIEKDTIWQVMELPPYVP